jgi:antitoxin HicB
MNHHYRMDIAWSEEDQLYLVSLPEFSHELQTYQTHGETYEAAARNGQEALESLLEFYQAEGIPLPQPRLAQLGV